MSLRTRPAVADDLPALALMNGRATPYVAPLSDETLRWLVAEAPYIRVATLSGRLAGFAAGLTSGTAFASQPLAWFRDRYDAFVFVERVVAADGYRRLGVGRRLYDDIARAAVGARLLATAVPAKPVNDVALAFHEALGFTRLDVTGGAPGGAAMLVRYLDARTR